MSENEELVKIDWIRIDKKATQKSGSDI